MALTLEALAARLDELEAANAELTAQLAEVAPPPAVQTHVICTDCFAEIAVEDGERWPDPDQDNALRWRCADREACAARMP